jgi:hypothetical protein
MAKRPRLSMTEYKEVVNQARMRRKIKEKQNKLLFIQNGAAEMCLQQEVLMNGSPEEAVDSRLCSRNGDVMESVVVSLDAVETGFDHLGDCPRRWPFYEGGLQ